MSNGVERFPFPEQTPGSVAGALPYFPIVLTLGGKAVTVPGLADSGATVNVLPFAIGTQLGADWDQQSTQVRLTGNLARIEARGLVVQATVGGLSPVRLVFAWTRTDDVPLLLGQMNFFLEFDVCFYRSRGYFEIRNRSAANGN